MRGHRRTYVGAMPGRIISAVQQAGVRNPLILLDEVDKLSNSYQGNPSPVLLEVLDYEHNSTYVDLFVGLPFDLSQVLFVATCNTEETVPVALKDRMEVLRIEDYTLEEKVQIALHHLIPKQAALHGLSHLSLTQDDVGTVIESYTCEAGVRQLERRLAALCRFQALRSAEGLPQIVFNSDSISSALGPPISQATYQQLVSLSTSQRSLGVGMCPVLSVTPAGGSVLLLETEWSADKLLMTGQLGKVMRESVLLCLSWVQAHFGHLHSGHHPHIHFPAGSVRKDGPSAGLALVVALTSLYTGIPVRSQVALTGEVTLSGGVLAVGGIKAKVLAAQRAHITQVIYPAANLNDVADLQSTDIELSPVSRVEEALDLALLQPCRPYLVYRTDTHISNKKQQSLAARL